MEYVGETVRTYPDIGQHVLKKKLDTCTYLKQSSVLYGLCRQSDVASLYIYFDLLIVKNKAVLQPSWQF